MSSKRSKREDSDEDEYVPDAEDETTTKRGRLPKKSTKNLNYTYEYTAATVTSTVTTAAASEQSMQDFSHLKLKKDHESRPLWITPECLIILEASSPIYQQAYDFLVAIAEPVARPQYVHRYLLTPNSLYAAVAVSIDTESIIDVLNRLCKTDVPESVHNFIRQCTCTFGKAKLVLKENKFYIESAFPDVLRVLLRIPTISAARIPDDYDATISDEERARRAKIAKSMAGPGSGIITGAGDDDDFVRSLAPVELEQNMEHTKLGSLIDGQLHVEVEDEDEEFGTSGGNAGGSGNNKAGSEKQNVSFRIHQDHVQEVKREALANNYPLMEEYDFKNDVFNPTLHFDLKPTTRIRLYQEKSLSKMFGNGRARSGIIVLPCGAGKSLTGVTAASTIKKSTMILCPNNVSVKQWKEQFLQWTTMSPTVVRMFTAEHKERLPPKTEACILLSTYTMISYSGDRAAEAKPIIDAIREREWGLMILDEVHLAPARVFRKVMNMVNAHCRLGLTATLVREDNLITDLNFLIGPKLYEANWMDLTQQGYLANVQCAEVWCPMTAEFFREYLKSANKTHRVQRLLYILNPNKIRVCEYLMKYHTHPDRGDKVIIFADDVVALELICTSMGVPFIIGRTQEEERREFISKFKNTSAYPCLGLSSVGDAALDIPEANVIIQVSSHFGARRQEAQRLGRILRPKASQVHGQGGFNAFFYTLVSTDTREVFYSSKRQQYLVDQGYTYKVVQDLVDVAARESTLLATKEQEINLLHQALKIDLTLADATETRAMQSSLGKSNYESYLEATSSSSSGASRKAGGSLSVLSGAGSTRYLEYSTSK